MEFILGMLTAYVLTWPGLIALFLLGSFFEYCDGWRPMAVIFGVGTLVACYFFFNLALIEVVVYDVAYVFIGVLWSFWRYKRFLADKVAQLVETKATIGDYEYRKVVEKLEPMNMLDTLISWIVIWPLSLVENLVGDILDGIRSLVTNVFKSVYAKLYASAMASLRAALG